MSANRYIKSTRRDTRFDADDVAKVRKLLVGGMTQAAVARRLGVNAQRINDVVRGRTFAAREQESPI